MNRHYRAGKEEKYGGVPTQRGVVWMDIRVRKMVMEPDCNGACVIQGAVEPNVSTPRQLGANPRDGLHHMIKQFGVFL